MTILYDKITFEGNTLFGRRIDDAAVKECPHVLAEAYFLYVRQGSCIIYAESDKSELKAGESIIMKGGMYVGHIFPGEEGMPFEAISVRFPKTQLETILESEFAGTALRSAGASVQKLNNSILIQNYVQGIVYYFENKALITPDILRLKLKEIVLLLLQGPQSEVVKSILSSPWQQNHLSFKKVIETHLYEDLSLEELSHLSNMSLSSFKRNAWKRPVICLKTQIYPLLKLHLAAPLKTPATFLKNSESGIR
jgi:hypothetical protein